VGLSRLKERREKSQLIETFKIVNLSPSLFFEFDATDRRGHSENYLR